MLPIARKKTRGHVSCLNTLNQWSETSRRSILHFFFLFYFQPVNNQSPVFTQTPKSKFNSPVLTLLNHFYEENPSLCSTIDPYTTVVLLRQYEELRIQILVISDHPTVARILYDCIFAMIEKITVHSEIFAPCFCVQTTPFWFFSFLPL